ncbi:MAG: RimK family alpha-L-glutamate ligase [Erysipelotrichaceae bacterium]|nr:RimK family alpha-L-glutamate ligase [Erysipelotrichaceae bacterium]
MMNGIIIVNQEIGHNAYKVDRLKEEFAKASIQVDVFVNDGTLASIENDDVNIHLPSTDFVIYMDKDIYLARLLEKAHYRLFNRADFIKLCDDKMLTFIACANHGIRMPITISAPLVYYELQERHISFLKDVESKLGFPLIVKKVYGSLGEGVYRINNHEELVKLYSEIYRNPIIFQEYISSSIGKSVRVLVIDGKVFGAFTRKNTKDFRSNYGTTAGGEKIDNIEKYATFAQKISDLLHIEYAGLDLLDNNGEIMLCEINSNAFFEEFELVTGQNVAQAIVSMIIRKVNDEQKR